jgi:nucleoside-diphosphate-sugar epimerase
VARALAARGARLFLVTRRPAPLGVEGTVIQSDLSRPEAVAAIFCRARPAVTFNLAGYGVDRTERDESTAFTINSELVGWVAREALAWRDPAWAGLHLVHTGSALEYGASGGNLDEDGPAEPTTLYGRSKLAGTLRLSEIARSTGLRAVTARLFTVYGPGEHDGRLLPTLIAAAAADGPIALTHGLQRRDFTYVADVAEGLCRLALSSAADIVNLATGQLASVKEFVTTAARVLQIRPDRLKFGHIPNRTEEMAHDAVTVRRLRALLGWIPSIDIEDGIRCAVEYARAAASRDR